MARKAQNKGKCTYCGKDMTRGGLSRHLQSCSKRKAAIEQATGPEKELYHLVINDAHNSDYWLHLEMVGDAALQDLDDYLRAIWLECCGHLSEFSIGSAWSGRTVAMEHSADTAFSRTDELIHIYDFGTSSETKIRCAGSRTGPALTQYPIALLARNGSPTHTCQACKKSATHYCVECEYEKGTSGLICQTHLKNHSCEDYGGPIEIINSPRLGMCGYTGPAEPPYEG